MSAMSKHAGMKININQLENDYYNINVINLKSRA